LVDAANRFFVGADGTTVAIATDGAGVTED
jgi:hypothetical protein